MRGQPRLPAKAVGLPSCGGWCCLALSQVSEGAGLARWLYGTSLCFCEAVALFWFVLSKVMHSIPTMASQPASCVLCPQALALPPAATTLLSVTVHPSNWKKHLFGFHGSVLSYIHRKENAAGICPEEIPLEMEIFWGQLWRTIAYQSIYL